MRSKTSDLPDYKSFDQYLGEACNVSRLTSIQNIYQPRLIHH